MNKYLKWGVIIFELVLIVSLVQGVGKSRKARERVGSLETTRDELVEERRKLLERLEYVQGEDYLESIAREELGLSKEGEVVVIVADDGVLWRKESPPKADQPMKAEKANWEKWLEVFGVE